MILRAVHRMQSETKPRRRQNRIMPDPNLKLIGDSTYYSQFRCKVNEILLVEHLEKLFKSMKTKLVAQTLAATPHHSRAAHKTGTLIPAPLARFPSASWDPSP